jgi:hypothetical protein
VGTDTLATEVGSSPIVFPLLDLRQCRPMKITREDLRSAATAVSLTGEQEEALWQALTRQGQGQQRFDLAHVAYYFGACVMLGAMGRFLTEAWDFLGGAGISTIALIYAVVFIVAGQLAWNRSLRVAGGLLFTLAVWMTPLVVYGIESELGWWPQGNPGSYRDYDVWVRGSWIVMEFAMIAVGAFALWLRRFPFLTFPIAFAAWYMSMDLAPLIAGTPHVSGDLRSWVSVVFGGMVLVVAYLIDMRGYKEDYAFWCYLFGLMAFWGGLTNLDSDSEVGKLLYFLINLGLIAISLFVRRRVFLVFGVLGAFVYFGHLAWDVFKDSFLFPFVLTIGGLAVMTIGLVVQRKREAMERWVQSRMPVALRRLVPPRAHER